MSKKTYNSPLMEIHALKVERGFAQSNIYEMDVDYSTEIGDVINGGFEWGI